MDQQTFQAKLMEIGASILSSEKFSSGGWDAISLVVTLTSGRNNCVGYKYQGEDWHGSSMGGDEFFDLAEDLQEITTAPTGEKWKQALIHITQPGPEINVKFEYDDPTRWSLKKVSLDLKDYAMSLHPNAA